MHHVVLEVSMITGLVLEYNMALSFLQPLYKSSRKYAAIRIRVCSITMHLLVYKFPAVSELVRSYTLFLASVMVPLPVKTVNLSLVTTPLMTVPSFMIVVPYPCLFPST